ncbi:Uncharacterized protein BM_BM17582 [Brugia malayi]|uniref:Uncharacterized protein n=2 Tax=Brugia TaxID=6278 RepID=A0A4E9FDR4_BRUMA|nr:Uncharacterized protein BM_BM17582 [Brugia malayi]VIO95035.1 Uncharacterized protein BM_BM17582 [Brugia malayi]
MMIHDDNNDNENDDDNDNDYGDGIGGIWYTNRSIYFQLLILFVYICKFNALTIDYIDNNNNNHYDNNDNMINVWKHSTHCSWHSSGGINDQIIQKVNLSCSKGYLQWIDPIGGMQVRFLIKNLNSEKICLRIRFLLPIYKILYYILDENRHQLINVMEEFQKCMKTELLDVIIFIEISKIHNWKQRIAGFQYEILPELLINNERNKCDICSNNNIINAFCNNADFVFEGYQSDANNKRILIDKILRMPMHYHQIIEKRNNQSILKAPVIGCLYEKDENKTSRIYIAKMKFDAVHIICSPTISHYAQIVQEQSENAPCQLTTL